MKKATVIRCSADCITLRETGRKPRAVSVLLDDGLAASALVVGVPVSFRLLGFDGRAVGGYFRRGVEVRAGGLRYRGLMVS